MYTQILKLASAIYNDVVSGLRGYHANPSMSMELLEDDIVDMRLLILKEYSLKGILPAKDLYISINCIPIDCKDLERCRCVSGEFSTPTAHFEIPLILNDFGDLSIDYIGSSDRLLPFIYYTTLANYRNRKYRKRGKDKPYVWIDATPNENNMYDCFVFNAPMLAQVSISAIFKDPRLLNNMVGSCNCIDGIDDNKSFINNEIKKRLTEQKLRYYRQFAAPIKPNNQEYTEG